jgi:glycosyltransferase involved in cell wall biosynthesis
MGTDISLWPYSWQPVISPRRIAFYGGLASPQNQRDALLSYQEIMPMIWKRFPDVEFWIVGSNPPDFIKNLEQDSRVHVTGFLENPQDVLKTTSFVLCPWSGTFGFRSRVVEVMSLGVPVLASRDAVYGMGFEIGNGISVSNSSAEMATQGLKWLNNNDELAYQSSLARQQIEDKFSYEATYIRLADELAAMLRESKAA